MTNETLPIGAPVAPEGTPQVGTPNEQTPAPQVDAPQTGLTLEQAMDALKKVRSEAASHRVKLNEFEQKQQEAERAKLSKEEQLQAQVADKERALTELQRTHQEALVAHAIEKAATKLGIVDPDAALKLLDHSQLDFAEDGQPKNADKLLRDLVQARPYLAGTPPVSPTNPATNHSTQSGTFTEAQLQDFDFYLKHEAEIKAAQRAGRITRG